MIKAISIIELMKTGRFGGVGLGMSDKAVLEILGEPESMHESEDAFLFYYGRWEAHFLRGAVNELFLIQNDQLLNDCKNHDEMIQFENSIFKIELDFIEPFKNVRLREVLDVLNHHQIKYILSHPGASLLIKLENNVYLDFINIESSIKVKDGFSWGPGYSFKEGSQISEMNDYALCALGLSNLKPTLSKN